MSQGIVKVTPRPGSSGQLTVTHADQNPYGVKDGANLSFPDPGFPVKEGDNVECTITSATTCKVIKVLVLA